MFSNQFPEQLVSSNNQKMLGNIKGFISSVQDGITSNNSLRQTLQEVQRVAKSNIFHKNQFFANFPKTEGNVNHGAGGTLLAVYQKLWESIHATAEKNARAAAEIDGLIVDINDEMDHRLKSAGELAQNLHYIPSLTAQVAEVMDSLKNVQGLMKTTEDELVEFEDVVERSKMEDWKMDHQYQLTLYKEKKMAGLEEVRNKLATDTNVEQEKRELAELQVKRENSSAAFNNDMAKYLTSGSIPKAPKSYLDMTLEQILLDVVEDNEDLENFLEEDEDVDEEDVEKSLDNLKI